VPPVEAQPAAAPAPSTPDAAPPVPLGAPAGSDDAPRPDPYAPPAPGYAAPGYGYQAPANPPASPYLQPDEPGYGQQPTYAQPAYPQYGYPPVAPKGLAITSMVLGLVGLLGFGFAVLASIGAVVTGHLAQRKQPYAKGFWLTGLITGYIGVGFFVLFLIFLFGFMLVYPNAA
jgi:hypothetical protein